VRHSDTDGESAQAAPTRRTTITKTHRAPRNHQPPRTPRAWRRIAASGLVLASVSAAALPTAGLTAAHPAKNVTYKATVKQGVLSSGKTVTTKVKVVNPGQGVKSWCSRTSVAKVVRKGVNGG
jgi:hypothetical protein